MTGTFGTRQIGSILVAAWVGVGVFHHLFRKGTKKETINGMRNYCGTVQSLDLQNERVTRRLEFVLNSYQYFRLTPGKSGVFDALAEAAWLGIPPD